MVVARFSGRRDTASVGVATSKQRLIVHAAINIPQFLEAKAQFILILAVSVVQSRVVRQQLLC